MNKKPFSYKKIKKEIDSLANILKKHKINPEKIILFGSYAKRIEKKYSDIDLAVISNKFGKDEYEELKFMTKVSWEASDRIEAISLTPKDMESKYHPLIAEIKKYGKVVYTS